MINPVNFVPNPSSLLSEAEQYQEYLQWKQELALFEALTTFLIIAFVVAVIVLVSVAVWLTRREADRVLHEIADETTEDKKNGKA